MTASWAFGLVDGDFALESFANLYDALRALIFAGSTGWAFVFSNVHVYDNVFPFARCQRFEVAYGFAFGSYFCNFELFERASSLACGAVFGAVASVDFDVSDEFGKVSLATTLRLRSPLNVTFTAP